MTLIEPEPPAWIPWLIGVNPEDPVRCDSVHPATSRYSTIPRQCLLDPGHPGLHRAHIGGQFTEAEVEW